LEGWKAGKLESYAGSGEFLIEYDDMDLKPFIGVGPFFDHPFLVPA
jgi:hypothetical protein